MRYRTTPFTIKGAPIPIPILHKTEIIFTTHKIN